VAWGGIQRGRTFWHCALWREYVEEREGSLVYGDAGVRVQALFEVSFEKKMSKDFGRKRLSRGTKLGSLLTKRKLSMGFLLEGRCFGTAVGRGVVGCFGLGALWERNSTFREWVQATRGEHFVEGAPGRKKKKKVLTWGRRGRPVAGVLIGGKGDVCKGRDLRNTGEVFRQVR